MTELFISYPNFKVLELDLITKSCPQSMTRALLADVPTSLGEFDDDKIILDLGLPDDVCHTPRSDEEYGPMLTLLIENDGSHQRLDLTLSRSSQDAHVHVSLVANQTNTLFDADLPIQEVDDEADPHKLP